MKSRHMQAAAQQILDYTAGGDAASFSVDLRTQQAVLFNFVVLGEAAAKLMEHHGDFLGQHPEVPWRSIRDMRNQVAHGYFAIDLGVVWQTIQIALPDLLARLPDVISAAEGPAQSPGS
jgi:uncharacterized protein with HEPN domain